MRRSIGLVLCVMVMMMASAEARLLPFNWDVKQELDPKNMKVLTINGKTPGPIIRAQRGDTIVVKVTNSLVNDNLAIRWQGIRQIGSPCDGTNGPILTGKTCTYRFVADRAGEYTYQSESRMQKEAGLYGPIRVLP